MEIQLHIEPLNRAATPRGPVQCGGVCSCTCNFFSHVLLDMQFLKAPCCQECAPKSPALKDSESKQVTEGGETLGAGGTARLIIYHDLAGLIPSYDEKGR